MTLKVLYFRTGAISLRHTDIKLWALDLINMVKRADSEIIIVSTFYIPFEVARFFLCG